MCKQLELLSNHLYIFLNQDFNEFVSRHVHMSDIEDQSDVPVDSSYSIDDKGVRKLLFKKRSTSSTCAVRFFYSFLMYSKIF